MTTSEQTTARRTAYALTALLTGMGVLHFVKPEPFDALIPKALPGSPRSWTYGSGVAELGAAALLALPRTRRIGGRAASLLFLGVYPGNLQMAWDWRHEPWTKQLISLGRLPLQADLVRRAELVHRAG
ncbi:DoxX family protein [Gephyromycinifex aptenodytis]|uniref:DoxX family protein n=1 Tax=Gephyromycinifex aptenodytis TaxID=2716227 RepID=UPI00144809D2|nr:hypothetical protein [Gephyromycinifex aptenodytis]